MALLNDLWAITSYFNPQRYRRRLANYRLFRQHLRLPLVTAELSFGNEFELRAGDADILLQVCEGDVMWQKERLLNLAIAALPPTCCKVVWLDCDLLIQHEDWPERLSRALDDAPVVQPFSGVYYLNPDPRPEDLFNPAAAELYQTSFVYRTRTGESFLDCLRNGLQRRQGTSAMGFAWAARRELLDKHGIYDACIVGGGNSAFACALYGCFDELARRHQMNDRQIDYYLAWAKPIYDDVRSATTFVDIPIFHLWHGAISNRRPQQRHEQLGPFQFDPRRDIALAPGGAWRWNSDKPALHQFVKDYFASRKEDE